MTASRPTTRTNKATRAVLHTKNMTDESVTDAPETTAIITNTSLARTHDSSERYAMIEALAYQFSEARGFKPGHELDDWLAAEFEVDQRLIREGRVY